MTGYFVQLTAVVTFLIREKVKSYFSIGIYNIWYMMVNYITIYMKSQSFLNVFSYLICDQYILLDRQILLTKVFCRHNLNYFIFSDYQKIFITTNNI